MSSVVLETLTLTTFFAGITISLPVAGFLPLRSGRRAGVNLAKPGRFTT
nr:MAG TPA: hypothetical protein [Caudoviricetes sp.]